MEQANADLTRAARRRATAGRRGATAAGLAAVAAASILLWAALSWLIKVSPVGPTVYNTYTLQAMAWRDGRLSLGRDYPWLELAVYQGDWYVSFPPVPTIPVWLLTFVFGMDTPDNALVKVYALMAMWAVYMALRDRDYGAPSAALGALATAFCGSAMALSVHGAVWYQAQMAALASMCLSVWLIGRGRNTWGLLCYALSVGCRPFHAVYGPLIMFIAWQRQDDRSLSATVRSMGRGVVLGLCVAAAMACYNAARFGNPLEFGTNYLPEFMRSEHGEFSLTHLPGNIVDFVLGLPFSHGPDGSSSLKRFGFSLFLANPLLIGLAARVIRDVVRHRVTPEKALCAAMFVLQALLLLLHRTFGGLQFGARYAVDLVPYAIIYMTLDDSRRLARVEWAAYIAGIALSVAGVWAVHI